MQADSFYCQLSFWIFLALDAERSHCFQCGEAIIGAKEIVDRYAACGNRADENSPMRNGFVGWYAYLALDTAGRMDGFRQKSIVLGGYHNFLLPDWRRGDLWRRTAYYESK